MIFLQRPGIHMEHLARDSKGWSKGQVLENLVSFLFKGSDGLYLKFQAKMKKMRFISGEWRYKNKNTQYLLIISKQIEPVMVILHGSSKLASLYMQKK